MNDYIKIDLELYEMAQKGLKHEVAKFKVAAKTVLWNYLTLEETVWVVIEATPTRDTLTEDIIATPRRTMLILIWDV